jgi:hypothetical protein
VICRPFNFIDIDHYKYSPSIDEYQKDKKEKAAHPLTNRPEKSLVTSI